MKNTTHLDHFVTGSLLFFSALFLTWILVVVPYPLNSTAALFTAALCGAGLILLLHYLAKTYHITAVALVVLPLLALTGAALWFELATTTTLWQTWLSVCIGALITRLILYTREKRKPKHRTTHYYS
ncbi:MAG: hypothetical protein MUC87_03500 [Bacteroidia bacterium]|nr:hypothetical protein [Bacteroidia bacterium]